MKRSFTGGSEFRSVGNLINRAGEEKGHRPVILDVGSSDCRHTCKILGSTPYGLGGWDLITIDPDEASLVGTPAGISRLQHFTTRFEELCEDELKATPNVILFSHSLYYFADPVATLERAAGLTNGALRIVVAMWSRDCAIRRVAGQLSGPRGRDLLSAEGLMSRAVHIGKIETMPAWEGAVNFSMWRADDGLARAVGEVLCVGRTDDQEISSESVGAALDSEGEIGRRINRTFSIDVAR